MEDRLNQPGLTAPFGAIPKSTTFARPVQLLNHPELVHRQLTNLEPADARAAYGQAADGEGAQGNGADGDGAEASVRARRRP